MSSRSHKQQNRRAARQSRKPKVNVKIAVPKALGKGGPKGGKNLKGRIKALPLPGFLGVRPREGSKRNKMTMRGLTMNGGTVTGVTEISPNLSLANSGQNVAGQILALIPLHPQLIAPGTRLSDVAAMYDQYVFSSIKFELDPSLPYSCGGRIIGFVERDATDPIGQMGTAVGNVQEWMDHGSTVDHPIQGGAGQAKLQFPRQGKYMYKIAKGPVGGYYLNKLAVNGSTTSTDINNCYQGQFVMMLHTPINSEGGQALSYPLPLGPLRVHWTLKFREAAERSQGQGGIDKHLGLNGAGGWTAYNVLQQTATLTKQQSLLSWSTLGIQTRCPSVGTVIRGYTTAAGNTPVVSGNFPIGFYYVAISADFAASGASQWLLDPASHPSNPASAQTGVTWIDYNWAQAATSATNVNDASWLQFEVTVPGELLLFTGAGNSSSWTNGNYASLVIVSIPASATSLLKHPNLTLRSLAFQKHVAKAGSGQALAAQIRQELGLPPKEEKDDTLEQAWKRILQDETKQDERNVRAHKPIDSWDSEEKKEDAWDEPDDEAFEDSYYSVRKKVELAPFKRVREEDEKSDRGKAPREQPRASSLKS